MSYKELQARAKDLGLKYVGVSAKKLKKNIKEALEKETSQTESSIPSPPVSSKPKDKKVDAVVYHGKRKIRTYTFEQHGKDYIKLAEQYISHEEREDYKIEFETVETRLTCPHCGKKFRYE